jgi:hypothetical protein
VPNRRRRRLSTATSAIAALAVTSPFAFVAVSQLMSDIKPPAQHREFVRAAVMEDLPNELISALSQGLSQFGVNLPPIPSLTGSSATVSPGLTSPGLSPGLTSPGLAPSGALPSAATPGLTDPSLAGPGLTNPALTAPGTAAPGLTTPGLDPSALNNPAGAVPGGIPGAGLDPGADGTYPIYGDPSLGAAPPASGGLVSDLSSAVQQLGLGQMIDLLKGSITQAAQGGAPAALPAPPVPAPPVPGL